MDCFFSFYIQISKKVKAVDLEHIGCDDGQVCDSSIKIWGEMN